MTPTPSARRHLTAVPVRPTTKWMLARLARIVAFGFGAGLVRPAPGTWGTLAAWAIWVLVVSHFAPWGVALLLVGGFLYGSWACDTVGRELGVPDHGGMVWDEMIAFWLVLWIAGGDVFGQALAFVLFRTFDIIKPAPIGYFDMRFKNGFGVMLDDLLAAIYALLAYGIIASLAR